MKFRNKKRDIPVTAEKIYPVLLTSSNTAKRVNEYSVPAERDDTLCVTLFPSGPVMGVSVPLLYLSM